MRFCETCVLYYNILQINPAYREKYVSQKSMAFDQQNKNKSLFVQVSFILIKVYLNLDFLKYSVFQFLQNIAMIYIKICRVSSRLCQGS